MHSSISSTYNSIFRRFMQHADLIVLLGKPATSRLNLHLQKSLQKNIYYTANVKWVWRMPHHYSHFLYFLLIWVLRPSPASAHWHSGSTSCWHNAPLSHDYDNDSFPNIDHLPTSGHQCFPHLSTSRIIFPTHCRCQLYILDLTNTNVLQVVLATICFFFHFGSFRCSDLWYSCNSSVGRYELCKEHSLPDFILSSSFLPLLSPSFHPLLVSLFPPLCSPPPLTFPL